MTLLDAADFTICEDAPISRRCSSATPKAAKNGPTTLVVCGPRRARTARRSSASAATSEASPSRNDGALDVKDVLRFERIVFTTDAYDAVVGPLVNEGGAK